MSAPSTVVTFVDEDGDEFPIRLPGVYRQNRAADIDAARRLLNEYGREGSALPEGEVSFARLEYFNEVKA